MPQFLGSPLIFYQNPGFIPGCADGSMHLFCCTRGHLDACFAHHQSYRTIITMLQLGGLNAQLQAAVHITAPTLSPVLLHDIMASSETLPIVTCDRTIQGALNLSFVHLTHQQASNGKS